MYSKCDGKGYSHRGFKNPWFEAPPNSLLIFQVLSFWFQKTTNISEFAWFFCIVPHCHLAWWNRSGMTVDLNKRLILTPLRSYPPQLRWLNDFRSRGVDSWTKREGIHELQPRCATYHLETRHSMATTDLWIKKITRILSCCCALQVSPQQGFVINFWESNLLRHLANGHT